MAALFADALPPAFLQEIDPTKRERAYGHRPLFWAWLSQILEGNASCGKAVSLIQSWCRAAKLDVPASTTSSYCEARGRLEPQFLQSIDRRCVAELKRRIADADKWRGFTLKAIDGSSVQLMDTPANQARYPQPPQQKAGCGFPVMGVVGLLNLSHGGWDAVIPCRQTMHDSKAAVPLLSHLHTGDLLLGDRAFCTYELIARAQARGAHVLMRLHQGRSRCLDMTKGKALGKNDRLMIWKRPARPAGSTLSQQEWDALPKEQEVRVTKTPYKDRTGEQRDLFIVTTLTDAKIYSAAELPALYLQRWEIEVKLRDLKTTLKMEQFAVKSPAMAEKTLQMAIIANNLVRLLMKQAASHDATVTAQDLSYKGALDLILAHQARFQQCQGPQLRAKDLKHLWALCASKRLDNRPERKEPRAIKRRPKNFKLLTQPRGRSEEMDRRAHRRKSA